MASSTMVSSSASGGMSSIGGKPSAPASSASRGDGFPLFRFSAVSRTMDSDCRGETQKKGGLHNTCLLHTRQAEVLSKCEIRSYTYTDFFFMFTYLL